MKASEARQAAMTYVEKLQHNHEVWLRKENARKAKEIAARKKVRWESLLAEINEIVVRRASEGGRSFLLDDIFYFADDDKILYDAVYDHFCSEGFTVTPYQYYGLMLEW